MTARRIVVFEHIEHEDWLYSLYPASDLAFFVRVGEMPRLDFPLGAVYHAKCTFAWGDNESEPAPKDAPTK